MLAPSFEGLRSILPERTQVKGKEDVSWENLTADELKANEKLCHSRSVRSQIDIGEYYVVDVSANFVLHHDVGLEAIAKKLGALKPYECLV
jgi:hypothetical protein